MVLTKVIFKVSAIITLLITQRECYWASASYRRVPEDNRNVHYQNLEREKREVRFNDGSNVNLTNQGEIIRYIDQTLEESLKEDKGSGCEMPKIHPFSKDVAPFKKYVPPIECSGEEWVTCYLSKCKVNEQVLDNVEDLKCTYRDIYFFDDAAVKFGPYVTLTGYHEYDLFDSDHVEIVCEDTETGKEWKQHVGGIRAIEAPKTPRGRSNSYNVLIFGYDSASKNGFIRMMPKTLQYIKNEMKAIVLESYHVVGDGTTAALFPILTGKREIDHPDCRKYLSQKKLDHEAFLFHMMKQLGYRTLYMEDFDDLGPVAGTFQRRFNGFKVQPADHYLRNFFIEIYRSATKFGKKWEKKNHCIGNVPQYLYMINITNQFLQMPGKKFCFTFISHITHNDFNMIAQADQPTVDFLKGIVQRGLLENTLIIIMGDHGTRFGGLRTTYQGKLEERLPFMAIRLPDELMDKRPDARAALEKNSDGVLTTPHDIYATIMDVLDLKKNWNPYKIKGSDLKRGMTLLEPIPRNRSCSEAGIQPHWCVCLKWERLDVNEPMYYRVALALNNKINSLTRRFRSQCALRKLLSIDWVQKKRPHKSMLDFKDAKDIDGYIGVFVPNYVKMPTHVYQVKITVIPGKSIFEATVTYHEKEDKIEIKASDITRTNEYKNEPDCISAVHPHLNFYCFCISNMKGIKYI